MGYAVEAWKSRALFAVQFFVAVIVFTTVAYGLYRLTGVALSSVPASIISILAPALVAHVFQRQQEIAAAQRQRKIDAYSGFMSVIFSDIVSPIHKAREAGRQPKIESADITDKMYGISAQIGLWAGNDVLTQYSSLLDNLIKPGSPDPKRTIFDDLGDMILIFRKDLGYRRRKVTARDLYPLFGVPRDFTPKPTEPQGVEHKHGSGTDFNSLPALPATTRRPRSNRPRGRSRDRAT